MVAKLSRRWWRETWPANMTGQAASRTFTRLDNHLLDYELARDGISLQSAADALQKLRFCLGSVEGDVKHLFNADHATRDRLLLELATLRKQARDRREQIARAGSRRVSVWGRNLCDPLVDKGLGDLLDGLKAQYYNAELILPAVVIREFEQFGAETVLLAHLNRAFDRILTQLELRLTGSARENGGDLSPEVAELLVGVSFSALEQELLRIPARLLEQLACNRRVARHYRQSCDVSQR